MQRRANTGDYVGFHAAERPDGIAFIENSRVISYAQLSRDLAKFTSALRQLGLEPGNRVAVGCEAVYVHWLLLAACERVGIATASYVRSEATEATPIFSGAEMAFAEPDFPTTGARRQQVITAAWLDEVFGGTGAEPDLPTGKPTDAARIIRTSGTTGASKRLMLTRGMYDAWIERWGWSLGVTSHTRYLLMMPFASTGRHTLTNAVLRAGGTVVAMKFESGAAIANAVARHSITLLTLLPIQLKQVLDALPADFEKPAQLTVATIGAAVADSLVEKAIARLATELVSYYGSNEIPFIAELRLPASRHLMTVFPWVEVEIVDDDGMPLPAGTTGWIRLKVDTMATGYLDDPETTQRMFRDGWFYPGDVGVLQSRRQLHVMGRGDELLNIGGKKIAPGYIEALVARHLESADVGVCSLPNPEGVEEIHVALAAPDGDDSELRRRLARAFAGFPYGNIRPVKVEWIPRNANGKILRGALKKVVAAATRRDPSPGPAQTSRQKPVPE